MKTVYKTSTKKKGKNKMSKVTIDVDVANHRFVPFVLAKNEDGFKVLVGTRGSEIVEFLKKQDESSKLMVDDDDVGIITRGHFKDEVWGLVVDKDPNGNTYITSGDDGYVRLWDFEEEKQIRKFSFGQSWLARSSDG